MRSLMLADFVNRHDMGMIELRDSFGLVLKAQELIFGGERARLDQLDRDRPIERDLMGLQDDAHPASPELAADLIARQAGLLASDETSTQSTARLPFPVATGPGEVMVVVAIPIIRASTSYRTDPVSP